MRVQDHFRSFFLIISSWHDPDTFRIITAVRARCDIIDAGTQHFHAVKHHIVKPQVYGHIGIVHHIKKQVQIRRYRIILVNSVFDQFRRVPVAA